MKYTESNARASWHALRKSVAYPENKANHSRHNESCGVVAEPGKIHGYLHPKVITDCIYNHMREELPQQTPRVAHNKVCILKLLPYQEHWSKRKLVAIEHPLDHPGTSTWEQRM